MPAPWIPIRRPKTPMDSYIDDTNPEELSDYIEGGSIGEEILWWLQVILL